jgi:hypothetical protein
MFNATRLLAERLYPGEVYSCFEAEYSISSGAAVHIVKAHRWLPHLALGSTVVDSVRDLDDVCASLTRMRQYEPGGADPELIEEYVEHWQRWHDLSEFTLFYQDLLDDPITVVQALSDQLFDSMPDDTTAAVIITQLDALPLPTAGVDAVTLLHAHHRAGR